MRRPSTALAVVSARARWWRNTHHELDGGGPRFLRSSRALPLDGTSWIWPRSWTRDASVRRNTTDSTVENGRQHLDSENVRG